MQSASIWGPSHVFCPFYGCAVVLGSGSTHLPECQLLAPSHSALGSNTRCLNGQPRPSPWAADSKEGLWFAGSISAERRLVLCAPRLRSSQSPTSFCRSVPRLTGAWNWGGFQSVWALFHRALTVRCWSDRLLLVDSLRAGWSKASTCLYRSWVGKHCEAFH